MPHSDIVFSVETVFHQFWTSLEKVWTVFFITCHQLMVNLFGTISNDATSENWKKKKKKALFFFWTFFPLV